MASIRNIANGGTSWWNKIYSPIVEYGGKGFEFVKMGWAIGRYVGWFIVTTGLITALPLVLELRREAGFEEFEKLQVGQGLAEGKTPQDLVQQGLTSAVEPKVL